MDMTMIDLSGCPNVDVGSEVEIFGENAPLEKMAEKASTIPYEITCNVSKRVPRIYKEGGKVVSEELMLRF